MMNLIQVSLPKCIYDIVDGLIMDCILSVASKDIYTFLSEEQYSVSFWHTCNKIGLS